MVVDLGVVVDVEPRRLPLGVDEWLGRERLERGLVEPLEKLPPARAVDPHLAVVQVHEQLGDPLVERLEREKRLVAQPSQDPALDHLHTRSIEASVSARS